MKISKAFEEYGYHVRIEGQSRRVIEHNEYIKRKVVEKFGDIELDQLDLKMVCEWRDFMLYRHSGPRPVKRKPNSLRCDILRLRCMLKYIKELGYNCLDYELVPLPKHEDTVRTFLDTDEVSRMIDATNNVRNKAMIALLYSSGVRVSELVSLNKDSIHDRCFSVVGKGRKVRLCFIDERAEAYINAYLSTRHDASNALFVSNLYKERLSVSTVQLVIRYARKRANINKPVTPHTFRHSFATNYIKNDGDIRPLSALLGHASLETTAIYTHIQDNELRAKYDQFHTF